MKWRFTCNVCSKTTESHVAPSTNHSCDDCYSNSFPFGMLAPMDQELDSEYEEEDDELDE